MKAGALYILHINVSLEQIAVLFLRHFEIYYVLNFSDAGFKIGTKWTTVMVHLQI